MSNLNSSANLTQPLTVLEQ